VWNPIFSGTKKRSQSCRTVKMGAENVEMLDHKGSSRRQVYSMTPGKAHELKD
jgi:hypothetical protein